SAPESVWWRTATLDGLAQGLGGGQGGRRMRGAGGEHQASENLGQDLLLKLVDSQEGEIRHASLRLLGVAGLPPTATPFLDRAAVTASKTDADPALRADSLGLLALGNPTKHEALFEKLIDPKQPEPVEAAAVRALGRVKGPGVGTFLLGHWRAMPPAARSEAADAMFLDPERPKLLLAAIQGDVVQPWTLAFR